MDINANSYNSNSGVVIAFFLPVDLAKDLVVEGGLVPSDLHITLAYLGDKLDLSMQQTIANVVSEFASNNQVIEGVINGVGLFNADSYGTRPLYLSFDSKEIQPFRLALEQALANAGVVIASEHGFTPHITLKYVGNGEALPPVNAATLPVKFDRLTFCWGDMRSSYELQPNPDNYLDSFFTENSNEVEPKKEVTDIVTTKLNNQDAVITANQEVTFAIGSIGETQLDTIKDLKNYVVKRGKVFEVGDYPDKNFVITQEEMQEAIREFKPVPLDYEHVKGWLDGKLGYLTNIAMGVGNSVMGAIALPKKIADLFDDMPVKLSLTWLQTADGKKRIKKAALTANPRVADAVVMAAFNNDANKKELNTALTDINSLVTIMDKLTTTEFVGNRHNRDDKTSIRLIHDIAASLIEADCQPMAGNRTDDDDDADNNGPNTIGENTFYEELNTMSDTTKQPDITNPVVDNDKVRVLNEQLNEERAKRIKLEVAFKQTQKTVLHGQAVVLADALIARKPYLNPVREVIITLAEQLVMDDEASKAEEIINFSSTTQNTLFSNKLGDRATALNIIFDSMPDQEYLMNEYIKTNNVKGSNNGVTKLPENPFAKFSVMTVSETPLTNNGENDPIKLAADKAAYKASLMAHMAKATEEVNPSIKTL